MGVLYKRFGAICCVFLFSILISCETINFDLLDEDVPVITVENYSDTVSIDDPYTVVFTVWDDEDDSLKLKKNTTIWVEDKWGDEVDLGSFTTVSGMYTIFLFTLDSDGNQSETVEIAVCVSTKDVTAPIITLIGPETYTVNEGDSYEDPGVLALDNFDGNLSNRIVVCGKVDTSDENDYTLVYTVRDIAGNRGYKDRVVRVKKVSGDDKEKPEIVLNGPNPLMVIFNDDFIDPGVTANDNEDGDITDEIESYSTVNTSVRDTYVIFYTVSDEAGNTASVKRIVIVADFIDSIQPVITLIGDNPMCLDLLEEYIEPGAEAEDNFDGNLTAQIEINDDAVDILLNGIYEVIYTVLDAAGNEAVEKRKVSVGVVDTVPPEIILLGPDPFLVDYKVPYREPGAYAKDDIDDSIPFYKFVIEKNINVNILGDHYSVTYIVKDKSGNADTAVRAIEVADTISPEITITGPEIINLDIGFPYTEKGATAIDNYDGDVTCKIKILGEVNHLVSGTYEITYKVTDSNGNSGESIRVVNVRKCLTLQ